jgi:hypothetical protein
MCTVVEQIIDCSLRVPTERVPLGKKITKRLTNVPVGGTRLCRIIQYREIYSPVHFAHIDRSLDYSFFESTLRVE